VRFRALLTVAIVGAGLIRPPVSLAQDADGLTIRVDDCIALESELARYDCYERLVRAALSEREDTVETAAEGQEERSPTIREVADERGTQPADAAEFVSTITALDEDLRNRYTITLGNGQIWRQMLAKRYALRVGQEVRVYPTRWGDSYRLSAKRLKGFIQVERVK
jgi:hypothetical protein